MKKLLAIALLLTGCRDATSYLAGPLVPTCSLTQSGELIQITCGTEVVTVNQISIQPFCPGRGGAYYSNTSYGSIGFLENYIQVSSTDYAIIDTGNVNGTYLTNLAVGSYTTSDSTGCNFNVNADGSITITN